MPKPQAQAKQAIQSPWWRWPLEAFFPDKTFDGQFQNPQTEALFDFDDRVMAAPDPYRLIATQIAYYPPGDAQELFTIFIPGLGQTAATSSQRSRRYAERLLTGIANLNNGSFLKQNPIFTQINPLLDWLDASIHRLGLSNSPVIDNAANLILHGIRTGQPLSFSADSHGTILLGRALHRAKRGFVHSQVACWNLPGRRRAAQRWQDLAHRLIHVFAFGNGYKNWVRGPKYIMAYITGDPVAATVGITPAKAKRRRRFDLQFLVFEPLFAAGNFEAHNMMFTTELIRQSFVKNQLAIGDFGALYARLRQGTFVKATAAEVPWPADMADYTWGAGVDLELLSSTELPLDSEARSPGSANLRR